MVHQNLRRPAEYKFGRGKVKIEATKPSEANVSDGFTYSEQRANDLIFPVVKS